MSGKVKYESLKSERLRIAIIGSGSVFTPELVHCLMQNSDALGSMEVIMMDIDKDRQAVVGDLCRRMIAKQGKDIKVTYEDDIGSALEGADFILLQYRQGGQDARIKDEKLGKKYKIPFVETISVCGFSTFLRTYYEMEKIAPVIKDKAPDAWVMNFTNPTGQLSEVLYGFGIEKVVGVCNASVYTINRISRIMGIPRDELFMNWNGLNHLTFIDAVYHKGKDVLPELIDKLDDSGCDFAIPKDLIKRLGVIPNSYLQYYYCRENIIKKLQEQERVRSEIVKEIDSGLLKQYEDKALDDLPEDLKKRGGYGYSTAVVNLLKGIRCNEGSLHYAVVKNGSIIPELPQDTFIETTVLANGDGVFPVQRGSVPSFARNLVSTINDYDRMTIEGAKKRDKGLLFKALMIHPLIGCHEIAAPLLDDCLEVNKEFIPDQLRCG